MSTKGMSNTAARALLDSLTPRLDGKVLVLHDFDVSGFSIFGTLGSNGRRYSFSNNVPLVDIGLRLADVKEMGLQSEPVETSGDWCVRAATLETHGAMPEEIAFLRRRRVELNAMPSDVFVRFLERKLIAHGVRKVVPADSVLEDHARDVITRVFMNNGLDTIRAKAKTDAASVALPSDLRQQIVAVLERQPEVPWDLAVADIARRALNMKGIP